ncbi:hypothetical protein GCM10018953_25270 [Streptosporangium nondiastaticum]|uniref:hypothetical protein n=1 Tax=Streptosporangium nondiastaticum TaxID=35764 RepID=UPI0031F9634E
MRGKGITYDTGFVAGPGHSTREPFDPGVVRREMQVIRTDLHCTAVRITGGRQDRLETAAGYAAEAGLEVWYSPFTCDLTTGELLDFLADGAGRAERLRRDGAEVVLLTGSELSLFTVGFLPGDTLDERLALLAEPARLREALAEVPARVNDFLAHAVKTVRGSFGGKVSYASLPMDGVDWTPFDIVSSDAGYRNAEIAPPVPRRHPGRGTAGQAARHHRVRVHHTPWRGGPGRTRRHDRRMGRGRPAGPARRRPCPR